MCSKNTTGIIVTNSGFDQALRIVRRGRADDLESGVVYEPHLGILGVERTAVNISATGPAKNEWGGSSPEVVSLRHHVADLVECAADEIHELKFGDGAHARERCSKCRADDGGLSDWRIDDALGTEAVDKSVCDFECAAVDADVFAEAEDSRIVFHFFPDSLADGFEVSELHRLSLYVEVVTAVSKKRTQGPSTSRNDSLWSSSRFARDDNVRSVS